MKRNTPGHRRRTHAWWQHNGAKVRESLEGKGRPLDPKRPYKVNGERLTREEYVEFQRKQALKNVKPKHKGW